MNYTEKKLVVFDEVNTDEAVSFDIRQDEDGLYVFMQKECPDEDFWSQFGIKLREDDVNELINILGTFKSLKRREDLSI